MFLALLDFTSFLSETSCVLSGPLPGRRDPDSKRSRRLPEDRTQEFLWVNLDRLIPVAAGLIMRKWVTFIGRVYR